MDEALLELGGEGRLGIARGCGCGVGHGEGQLLTNRRCMSLVHEILLATSLLSLLDCRRSERAKKGEVAADLDSKHSDSIGC